MSRQTAASVSPGRGEKNPGIWAGKMAVAVLATLLVVLGMAVFLSRTRIISVLGSFLRLYGIKDGKAFCRV